MKKISIILSVLLCCVWFAGAQVVGSKDMPVVEKILAGNKGYTSMTADFKQTQHLPFVDDVIASEGKCYYKKPEQMAMVFTDPEGDMMLVDGNRFVLVSAGSRQEVSAASNPRMQGMKQVLNSCMAGDVQNMGAKKITCEETPALYLVKAELAEGNIFEKVEVGYDKKDLSLTLLKTIESDGSYTQYELGRKAFNKAIDAQVFKGK